MQLQQRQPDGATLREHLQAAVKAGAAPDPRLLQRVPPAGSALWAAFVDLSSSRPSGLGPSGIPPSEIAAWQQLHGLQLTPWEVEAIQAMDRAALRADAKPKGSH